jgi:hypothetical protein
MNLLQALVSSIYKYLGIFVNANFRTLEQLEIVPSALLKARADYLAGFLVRNYLSLLGVAFFLA